MKTIYVGEGIVEKVYGDEGEVADLNINGLYVMATLLPFMETKWNINPNKVKVTIEIDDN